MSLIDDEQAYRLAQFVPANERTKLLNIILEAFGENISKTAKEIKVSRSQIYRYLGKTRRRDVPSDEILARIIIVAYRLRPAQTKDFFKFLLRQMRELVSNI
ncbi:MAG: helix-turn-helix domain-containing protein [Candidatus Methanomethylicia archaeon]|nr:helix-turn-helix domain-containing protein [Candidatus Methanomethylicia archaeon]MCX8169136.1 helix-turn-helix domain-containing protein [Candidatus Methanomethylicia archaeon]MDW7988868.1 helix-turn-helix domain-containing protein [Nitrososphaerota archaeon]